MLETIDEGNEGTEDTEEASSSDGEMGVPWIKLCPPTDQFFLEMVERSKIDKQDNVRGREWIQAIDDEATVASDTAGASSETKYTDDIQIEWPIEDKVRSLTVAGRKHNESRDCTAPKDNGTNTHDIGVTGVDKEEIRNR